jgi:ssDNA-binding Zn-finger/Zn-ribbon topoisomerase 1
MTTIKQISDRTLLDVIGCGECPQCKTERDLVQDTTIECATCGEPYLKDKWRHISWNE